jgi:hypothetical protein
MEMAAVHSVQGNICAVDLIQKPFRREGILNKLANITTGVLHTKPRRYRSIFRARIRYPIANAKLFDFLWPA